MSRHLNKKLVRSLLKAHLFLLVIFFVVIAITIILPMQNVGLLINVEFYKNIFSSPLLWALYVIVLAVAVGKSMFLGKIKK
jgi:hypothetical protein